MIGAAVKSGQYSDPAAEAYVIRTLVRRRDAIGRAFLTRINPIVSPSLGDPGLLTFHNAAVDSDCAPAPTSYHVTWYRFDNATGDTAPLGERTDTRSTAVQAPSALPREVDAFVRVDIAALAPAYPSWRDPVRAYFRRTTDSWALVGLEHERKLIPSPDSLH
jgi:hypothetical protein